MPLTFTFTRDLQYIASIFFYARKKYVCTYLTYINSTKAVASVLEPPNLKVFWAMTPRDPPKRLVPSAPAVMPPRPLATAPFRRQRKPTL